MTLFAFDAGEAISTHAAGGDAMAFVLEGEAEITIDGTPNRVTGGHAIILPCGVPHAVKAITQFKMLLSTDQRSLITTHLTYSNKKQPSSFDDCCFLHVAY